MTALGQLHAEWCDANGCRCGGCPCSCQAEAVITALPDLLREQSPAGDALREHLGFHPEESSGVLVGMGPHGQTLAMAYPVPGQPGLVHTLLGVVPRDQVRRYRQWRLALPWVEVKADGQTD